MLHQKKPLALLTRYWRTRTQVCDFRATRIRTRLVKIIGTHHTSVMYRWGVLLVLSFVWCLRCAREARVYSGNDNAMHILQGIGRRRNCPWNTRCAEFESMNMRCAYRGRCATRPARTACTARACMYVCTMRCARAWHLAFVAINICAVQKASRLWRRACLAACLPACLHDYRMMIVAPGK